MQLIFLCRESTWSAASTVRGALWEEYCRHKQAAFKKICLESVWALPRETDYRNVCKMYLSLKTFVLLWKQPCDLLVINKINYHTLGAVLFCFLRRKPYILDVDDWEYRATGGDVTQTKTLFQRLGDRFALGAYAVVVASTFLKEYFSFCARVVYIPSCSLPDRDAPVPEPSESVRFCWMGMVDRFDAIDSVREILRVFTRVVRQYPGIRLVIIGKGIFEKELHRLEASDCLPQVQFHYAIDSRDIPAYLAKIDAGVLLFPEKNVFYQARAPRASFSFLPRANRSLLQQSENARYSSVTGSMGSWSVQKMTCKPLWRA